MTLLGIVTARAAEDAEVRDRAGPDPPRGRCARVARAFLLRPVPNTPRRSQGVAARRTAIGVGRGPALARLSAGLRRARSIPTRRLSRRLGALGREDTARSERLAGACMAAWHARHSGRWEFAETVDANELTGLSEALLVELDEVAALWHALSVGEALTLTWPARLTIRPGGSSRGRRPNRDRGMAARRR